MTLARRVAALEATLTPTQAVLRWLEEAQAFPSTTEYARALASEQKVQKAFAPDRSSAFRSYSD